MKTKKKKTSQSARKSSKPKAKAKKSVKTKSASKRSAKTKKVSARPAAKKKSKGLSVADLFRLKEQQSQEHHPMGDEWKHKKTLPLQDQHKKEDMRAKNNPTGRKSGFGGVRHH